MHLEGAYMVWKLLYIRLCECLQVYVSELTETSETWCGRLYLQLDMVLQKRLDYGFGGFQVPAQEQYAVPRFTRSARGKDWSRRHEHGEAGSKGSKSSWGSCERLVGVCICFVAMGSSLALLDLFPCGLLTLASQLS
ncbi:hypothetical protein Sjap_019820 [Stephania japonica]|uniref:Uncharacterized protein n=1 Tax=Stephania japonica TaxID=461633 RepID=A0AAP0F0W4_9MAGN